VGACFERVHHLLRKERYRQVGGMNVRCSYSDTKEENKEWKNV